MRREEYEIMFRVEDRHWWYVGLRSLLDIFWAQHVRSDRPLVLDVGCGTGATLTSIADRGNAIGVDYSIDAIRFCRQRGQRSTLCGSGESMSFPDNLFDVVFSLDVLCHKGVVDKQGVLNESVRVLKPGGLLLLNAPAYDWLKSSHDIAVYTDKRFTGQEIETMLRRAGCTPLRLTYWNAFLFPAVALVRIWRRLRPRPASDLDGASGESLGAIFERVLALERLVIRRFSLPFGLSIMVAARKDDVKSCSSS